jgi:putative hemolysin
MLEQAAVSVATRATRHSPTLQLSWARSTSEIREAQRLRYKVFVEELGARINNPELGLDSDQYDQHCEHLLVRDADRGEVIGAYRLLPGPTAIKIGGFYAEQEFDLSRLRHQRAQTLELGRSCVHRDYRTGATIARLWAGIANYAMRGGYQYVIGCASLSMADGGHAAASIYRKIARQHLAPVEYRTYPRCELPLAALEREVEVAPPALVKGYIRVGAYVCGAPAWDPDFNTADLFMLLPMARMDMRYARHFMVK